MFDETLHTIAVADKVTVLLTIIANMQLFCILYLIVYFVNENVSQNVREYCTRVIFKICLVYIVPFKPILF